MRYKKTVPGFKRNHGRNMILHLSATLRQLRLEC
jgi:hypothetical protein